MGNCVACNMEVEDMEAHKAQAHADDASETHESADSEAPTAAPDRNEMADSSSGPDVSGPPDEETPADEPE